MTCETNLEKFFSMKEIDDIESAFEGNYKYPFLSQMQEYIKASDLLIFIMKQIIAQKGRFDIKKAEKAAKNERKPKSK